MKKNREVTCDILVELKIVLQEDNLSKDRIAGQLHNHIHKLKDLPMAGFSILSLSGDYGFSDGHNKKEKNDDELALDGNADDMITV